MRARTADRSDMAHLRVADQARGVRHDRRQLLERLAVGHVVVPGQGADGDLPVVLPDVGKVSEPRDVDQ